jgi:hypothetical protein
MPLLWMLRWVRKTFSLNPASASRLLSALLADDDLDAHRWLETKLRQHFGEGLITFLVAAGYVSILQIDRAFSAIKQFSSQSPPTTMLDFRSRPRRLTGLPAPSGRLRWMRKCKSLRCRAKFIG